MTEQFFTDEQLRERWRCGRTTLYRMRQEGRLPPPVKISGHSKGRNLTRAAVVEELEGKINE